MNEEKTTPDSKEKKTDLSNKKILVVEDNQSNYYFLEVVLKSLNANIVRCSDGKEAVEAVRNQHFDLIFMDLKLPEMSGYEASRKIKAINKDIIIIAQTAFAMSGDKEKAIEAGCDDYLTKPIRADEIQKMAHKYLQD